MGGELPQRDRLAVAHESGRAGRQVLRHRIVERDLAAHDRVREQQRRERLGDGADLEHGVGRDRGTSLAHRARSDDAHAPFASRSTAARPTPRFCAMRSTSSARTAASSGKARAAQLRVAAHAKTSARINDNPSRFAIRGLFALGSGPSRSMTILRASRFGACSRSGGGAALRAHVFWTTMLGNFAEKSAAFSATEIATLRAMSR